MKKILLLVSLLPVACSAGNLLHGGNFEWAAADGSGGWRTSSPVRALRLPRGGIGATAAIGLEDDGTNNCKWLSPPVKVKANSLYGLSVRIVSDGGGLTMGTPEMNVTEGAPETDGKWGERRMVVFSSDRRPEYNETFRLGEYHLRGRFVFDDARVVPLEAVYGGGGGVELGHGERIAGTRYFFNTQWSNAARFHSRPLYAWRGLQFNTGRVTIGSSGYVVYRHELTGRTWETAAVNVTGNCLKGALAVEFRTGESSSWRRLASVEKIPSGGLRLKLPPDAFPADRIDVRIALPAASATDFYGYSFEGGSKGPSTVACGSTRYLEKGTSSEFARVDAPSFYTSGYGKRLKAPGMPFSAWTAHACWKIPKSHPLPDTEAPSVRVAAAANEVDEVQLVLTHDEDLASARVVAGDLVCASGKLPASAVEIFRVGYVPVVRVMDRVGCADDWPDTLLGQDAVPTALTPATLKAGETTPYWVRVSVPKGTKGGIYRGTLKVACSRAAGGSAAECDIPFEVEVYGFELPERMSCRTSFGLYTHSIDRYHRVRKPEDRRRVYDMYYSSLAAHRLSPMEPAPGARWKFTWKNGEPVFDWTGWDKAMQEAFDRYGFSDFKLPPPLGLGGGNEAERINATVPGLQMKADHPEYEKHVGKYLQAIEKHLEEKGWLERAYIYCYDEPRPEADVYVQRGLALAAKYAPRIDRILTAPVRPTLVGGPNIWCPVAPGLDAPGTDERRAAGDKFWLYVCMYPKPPYPSLFIDHPGVDLRVWLWQCWREKIEGILVWNTTWWTSDLAYPDKKRPQNPYLDATAWSPRYPGVGASNGDGRFFYPPPRACAAFDEGTDIGPVFDRPVETVRLEHVRDGIEDYEYFAILKRLDPGNPLLKVPAEVSASSKHYSIDPVHMARHREKLAREIERISSPERR